MRIICLAILYKKTLLQYLSLTVDPPNADTVRQGGKRL